MHYALGRDYGERALEILRKGDVANYLALIMRVARVGGVSVAERDLAIPLAKHLEASEETTLRALQLADDPGFTMSFLAARLTHPVQRLCLYRDACRMSLADGFTDPDEQGVLEQLALALELQPTLAKRVEELVRRVWEAQEEFLKLLP